ncbi:MAG: GNAT family N-acetyltransferase [Egibacteraceae bacterium]
MLPSSFTIRVALPADLDAARQLMLRVFDEDFAYGYLPQWHWDVDDLKCVYLGNPRHCLWVAVDDAGAVVGTAAVREGGPLCPPNPRWLADRYAGPGTAQLVRVYVTPALRGRGIGRALVDAARRFVAVEGGYRCLYLHTDTRVAGAEAFWRALGRVVCDARHDEWSTVHFEIDLPTNL